MDVGNCFGCSAAVEGYFGCSEVVEVCFGCSAVVGGYFGCSAVVGGCFGCCFHEPYRSFDLDLGLRVEGVDGCGLEGVDGCGLEEDFCYGNLMVPGLPAGILSCKLGMNDVDSAMVIDTLCGIDDHKEELCTQY